MEEQIINRVANSKLVTFNLEDLYPEGKRISIDISQWLLEGIVLREKEFRKEIKEHDWSQYDRLLCKSLLFYRCYYSRLGIYVSFASISTVC